LWLAMLTMPGAQPVMPPARPDAVAAIPGAMLDPTLSLAGCMHEFR
jgi:hypothetical protein